MTGSLPLRHEAAPDDATVIIRAGIMAAPAVVRAAERTYAVHALHGISVEAAIDVTVLEACLRSQRLSRYPQLRLSTFGRLRLNGFPLLATFDHPHFTLVLPDISELTIARLLRSFGDPIPNPARGGRR